MDPALLSAGSALAGSLIGAAASFATTWLTQHGQLRAQRAQLEAAKREALYAEFITEVARRLADGMAHEPESAGVLVALHAAIGRMRLMSSREVLDAAEALARLVMETYAAPNLTFQQLRESMTTQKTDPLESFGEACRVELRALRG